MKLFIFKGSDVERGISLSSKSYIKVGVKEGVHVNPRNGETMSMVELAQALHYGTANTPPRPFLDDAMREMGKEIAAAIQGSMVWRFQGLKANVQFAFAANEVTYIVRKFIKDGEYYRSIAPNAKSTIEAKGGDTPLVDSSQLVNAIEAKYVELR